MMIKLLFSTICLISACVVVSSDLPCYNRTVSGCPVCVCNASYCDTISTPEIDYGMYAAFTTDKRKRRFKYESGPIHYKKNISDSDVYLEIDHSKKYQSIIGFGGAVTDSTIKSFLKLSSTSKQNFLEAYFGQSGLQYNLLRVHVRGDYNYAGVEVDNDSWGSFYLPKDSSDGKIEFLREVNKIANNEVYNIAVVEPLADWISNDNDSMEQLDEDYYQNFADYYVEICNAYWKSDISFWAVSTGDKPYSGASGRSDTLAWYAHKQAEWIVYYLAPTIGSSKFHKMKIIGVDDVQNVSRVWLDMMTAHSPAVLNSLDGIGFHATQKELPEVYLNVGITDALQIKYPDKFIIQTESCFDYSNEKIWPSGDQSWERAENLALQIIEHLKHNVSGWLDYSLAVDEYGKPKFFNKTVDAPVVVPNKYDGFFKLSIFYVMGHFSKFIIRDSERIDCVALKEDLDITYVAFLRPDKMVAIVLYNKSHKSKSVTIREKLQQSKVIEDHLKGGWIRFKVPPRSIKTILYYVYDMTTNDYAYKYDNN